MQKQKLSLSGKLLYQINYEMTTWREKEKKKKNRQVELSCCPNIKKNPD